MGQIQEYQEEANFYNSLDFLQGEMNSPVEFENEIILPVDNTECRLMHITNLTYEKDFPRLEAFENVVASLNNKQNCRLIYYLHGTTKGIELYIGVAQNGNNSLNLNIRDYRDSLERSFKGNFVGTRFYNDKASDKSLEKKHTKELQEGLRAANLHYSVVLGVPSKNADKDALSFQGVDRLINIMSGESFHLIVIWEPIEQTQLKYFDYEVKRIYGDLAFWSKKSVQASNQVSIQNGTNTQESVSYSHSESKGWSQSVSHSENKGWNQSISHSENEGWNKSLSHSENAGWNHSESEGTNYSIKGKPQPQKDTREKIRPTGKNKSSTFGISGGASDSISTGISDGTSDSVSVGISGGISDSVSVGISGGTSDTWTASSSRGKSHSETRGFSIATTREVQDKAQQEILKYIDEELLLRLKQGQAKGMYKTAMYLGTENEANLTLLENTVTSIFQGDKSTFYPLHARKLPKTQEVRDCIANFAFFENMQAIDLLPLFSRPAINNSASLTTCLTSGEISILAGMPQKEVAGLELREQVEFGLNTITVDKEKSIELGSVYQEGSLLTDSKVYLNKNDLKKHIFIAGTTGSGKTTTCQRLLCSSELPFLVIEPVKTEYRVLLNNPSLNEKGLDDETIQNRKNEGKAFGEILFFTVGNEKGVPFRFNPFEFLPTENLSGHVDLLKACFMASFDMEAAIPNLLEEGLYKVYERFGWDFSDNSNFLLENREDAWKIENGGKYFPTISDYINILEEVVNSKGFDSRLKNDYLGSIRGRLDSLRTGMKKLMLDTRLSVNFEELLDRRVVIELEELKSGEDKSFIMGLILGRLTEALKARHKKQNNYQHITLVEEAHRLLTRPMSEDSPNKKLGVEMFTDLLAEVRKYGESLVIVDQIPNKLAPEVLKNTNTKIIHKIFARDDKEAVGDTMALDEKHRNYLSHLLPGEAIVFTQGWLKPVDTQIEQLKNVKTTEQEVSDEEAFLAGWKYWEENPVRFCPVLAKNTSLQTITREDLLKIKKCTRDAEEAITQLIKMNKFDFWLLILEKSRKSLSQMADEIFRGVFISYFLNDKLMKEANILNTGNFEETMLEEPKEIIEKFLQCKTSEEVEELRNDKKIRKYFN